MDALSFAIHVCPWTVDSVNNIGSLINDLFVKAVNNSSFFSACRRDFFVKLKVYELLLDLSSDYFFSPELITDSRINKLRALSDEFYDNITDFRQIDDLISKEKVSNELMNYGLKNANYTELINEFIINKMIEHNIPEIIDYFMNTYG